MRSHEIQENDAFMEAKSHAAEVEILSTYAPADEFGMKRGGFIHGDTD